MLLSEADGIFRRSVGLAGFHFDEDQDVAVPGDEVDFAVPRAVARGDDAIAERAKVVGAIDFGTAAEGKNGDTSNMETALTLTARRSLKRRQCALGQNVSTARIRPALRRSSSGGESRIVEGPAPRTSRPRSKHSSMIASRSRGFSRCAVLDDLDTDHQTEAANITDHADARFISSSSRDFMNAPTFAEFATYFSCKQAGRFPAPPRDTPDFRRTWRRARPAPRS